MARKLVVALAIILMLAAEGTILNAAGPREQSAVVLQTFADGSSSAAMFYEDPGNNTSMSIKMPQRVTILNAAVNISAQPATYNDTINVTTMDDFLNLSMGNIDVNSSSGDATLGKPYDDDFNDLSLDPRWNWSNACAYDEGNVTPGALALSANANTTFWNGANNGTLLSQNITGATSWQVTVRVNCTPTVQGQRAGILLRWNRTTWVDFSVARNATTTVLSRTNTTNNVSLAVNMSIAPGPVWLRFYRYYYNYLYFLYSTNGVSFSYINSMNLTWISSFNGPNSTVGLDIMDGGSGTAFNATFDDFVTDRWYTSGHLISPVREYKDEVQSTQLHWNMTGYSNYLTVSARASPGDGTWKTLYNHTQFDFPYPKGYIFQYNVTMTGSGSSWGNPVLKELWGNITVKSIPTNVTLDIGNKGMADWRQNGPLGDHPIKLNITSGLIAAVAAAAADENGDVTLALRVQSDKRGTVILEDLAIEYVVNSPPVQPGLNAPANDTWVTTLWPTLEFNTTDQDGGLLWYTIEVQGPGTPFRLDQKANSNGWSAQSYPSGEMASYTFPHESRLSNGDSYSWSVRAFDGFAYGPWSPKRVFKVDENAPEGWVSDDGTETTSGTSLHANITIKDDQSGIVGYEVWVGTKAGLSDIVPPTRVNTSSVTFDNLTLIYGNKYYFTARAQNGAGLWSANYSSDGIGVKKGAVNHLPSLSLSSPSDGDKLTGVVKFRGNATDIDFLDLLTTSVQVDGGDWMDCEGNRSWNFSWDSSRVENGPHSIHVRTSDGKAYSDTITINASITNVHEITITGAEPLGEPRVSENQSVSFSISARDPFNRTLGYQWLIDGSPVPGATSAGYTWHTDYSSAGVHNVTVSVYISPMEANYTWNVTVSNINRPPVAAVGAPASGTEVSAGKQIQFDATGSSDPDASDTLNYTWDFGDGNQAGGLKATHAYKNGGRYIVTLMVSDPSTYSTASIEVLVKAAPQPAPSVFEQYGLYIMAALVSIIIIGIAVVAISLGRKRPAPETRVPAPGKAPVPEKGVAVAERGVAAAPGAGAPAARQPARRPAAIEDYGGILTVEDEPAARQARLAAPAAHHEPAPAAAAPQEAFESQPAPQGPYWTQPAAQEEAPVYGSAEGTEMPAWAAPAKGPAYVRVEEEAQRPSWAEPAARAEEQAPPQAAEGEMLETMYPVSGDIGVPQTPAQPEEAPAEPVEPPMDEMTRILNMLAPPQEEPAPEPALQEGEESSGMDDVFARLRSISDEFEAQPIAPAPKSAPAAAAAAAPVASPARAPPMAPPRKPAAPPAYAPRPAAAPPAPAPRPAAAPPQRQAAAQRPAPAPHVPPMPAMSAPAAAAAGAPSGAQVPIKKRLLRCPKCQVVFEVQDTGVRPLPIKCTACGTTGSLKK